MINSYIIMNRKITLVIKLFHFIFILLILFVIYGINNFYYQSYIVVNSKILKNSSFYSIELLVPVKEVNKITNNDLLLIDSKVYNYKVKKVSNDCTYKNKINYLKIYITIDDLDRKYLISNYHFEVKIPTVKKKIIDYLKNKEE